MPALKIALLILFICVPLTNYFLTPLLSDAGAPDGGAFADDIQTRISAAGYAFAIWGIIFTGMLIFPLYLLLTKARESADLKRAMWGLIIAGLASITFVPLSIYGNPITVWLIILAHLIPLIVVWISLRRYVNDNPQQHWGRFTFFGPSMYLGWISAATVISTSLVGVQVGIELDDKVATTLTIAVLLGLSLIAITMTLARDAVFGGTVAWALIGVGVKQSEFESIQMTAWIGAAIIVVAIVYQSLAGRGAFYATTTQRKP